MLACGPSWALHLGSSRYGISWAGAVWKHRRSSMNLSLRHLHLAGNDSGWTVWQQEKSTLALGYTGMQNCGIWHWHITLACHLYCMITDDHIVWITRSKDFKSNWDVLRLLPFCSQINAVQQQSSVYLVVQHVRLRDGNKSISIRVAFVNVVIAASPYDEVFFLTQAEKSGDETTYTSEMLTVSRRKVREVTSGVFNSAVSQQEWTDGKWSKTLFGQIELKHKYQRVEKNGRSIAMWLLPVPYSIPSFKGDVDSRDLNIFAPLAVRRKVTQCDWCWGWVWEAPNDIAIPGDWRSIFRQGRSLQSSQWALEMHPEGWKACCNHRLFSFGISGTCWNGMSKLCIYNIYEYYMIYNDMCVYLYIMYTNTRQLGNCSFC